MSSIRALKPGVFPFLTSYAAFVDTVAIGIKGQLRSRPKTNARVMTNRPIRRSGGQYARTLEGICCLTGNPFAINYGKQKRFSSVAPYRMTLRSERAPITLDSVEALNASVFRKDYRAQVNYVELSFDTHVDVRFLRKHVCTKATVSKRIADANGCENGDR